MSIAQHKGNRKDKNGSEAYHTLSVNVPDHWKVLPLDEVLDDIVGGGTPSKTNPEYWSGSIPWLSVKDMRTRRPEDAIDHISKDAVRDSATNIIPADTVIIATRIGLGKVIRVSYHAAINQDLKALVAKPEIEKGYLEYWILSIAEYLESIGSGTTVKGIRLEQLRSLPFPVAPLKEQKRIVAEIEKQFSRLDEAVANLKRITANLKRYKAAVLKAAVEGKLTEEWRLSARAESRRRAQASELKAIPKAVKDKWFIYIIECNDGSYYVGHTADLHARWQAHCEGSGADWTRQHPPKYLVHYEACGSREEAVKREKDLKTGSGRTWRNREIDAGRIKPLVHNPKNDTAQPVHDEDIQTGSKLLERILTERRAKWKGKGKYKEPTAPDTTYLPELPVGWLWTSLDNLIVNGPQNGVYLPKLLYGSGHPILRIDDYQQDWIRPVSELQRVRAKPEDVVAYSLQSGDIVINRVNSPSHLGKVAVWGAHKEKPMFESNMMRAGLSTDVVPLFVAAYLRSAQGRVRLTKQAKWAVNQASINQQDVCGTPIPIPPFAEQKHIVFEVERQLSVTREFEHQVDANIKRADRLRQSILRMAFTGKLFSPCASSFPEDSLQHTG